MRAGVFAEYALPLGSIDRGMLGDYSGVNANPSTLTEADMRQNLVMNSVLDSEYLQRNAHLLTVGVRLTLMFDVTVRKEPCHCTPTFAVW